MPTGNLAAVILDFIDINSVKGQNYAGEEVLWMRGTKQDFAAYVLDHVQKSFYERFYYPLGLTEQNIEFIARQLNCGLTRDKLADIAASHMRKDVYDIYNYGMDAYGNMYTLYKRYGKDSPTYQEKKNTLGEIWVRLKDHPIAFPLVLPVHWQDHAAIDMDSANQQLKDISKAGLDRWCYDFNFSDNKRLVCFSTVNMSGNVPEYFAGKFKYSQQAIALVTQKDNTDLGRPVLKISNPDDVPDDIVTQPHLKQLEEPQEGKDTWAY